LAAQVQELSQDNDVLQATPKKNMFYRTGDVQLQKRFSKKKTRK